MDHHLGGEEDGNSRTLQLRVAPVLTFGHLLTSAPLRLGWLP